MLILFLCRLEGLVLIIIILVLGKLRFNLVVRVRFVVLFFIIICYKLVRGFLSNMVKYLYNYMYYYLVFEF